MASTVVWNLIILDEAVEKYTGIFKKNKQTGSGTLYWKNGKKYVGQFLNDHFHGEGTVYSPSGEMIMKGKFENGVFKGLLF